MIYKSPLAETDIIDIAVHIANNNPDAAERFLKATEETFAFLVSMPLTGHIILFKNSRAKNVRVWSVQNFDRFLIFYRPVEDSIEIIRLLHTSRDIEAILGGIKTIMPYSTAEEPVDFKRCWLLRASLANY